jgi:high-affinity iron transporter
MGLLNVTFNFQRSVTAVLLAFLAVVSPLTARADPGDPPEVEAQRLVHILGYTAGDYGGAVAGGAVINATEYEEQLALLADAQKIAADLHPAQTPGLDIAAEVGRVRGLVERKAPEAEVAAAVAAVRAAVTAAFQLAEAPTAPPDAARGQALYAEHCATCHGDRGHADTDRARSLTPHPADFHDPRISDPLSPLRAAGTVRFGINGTSMIPFSFLSDADRWALAFHVTGLRHTAAPADDAPTYTLAELSVRSDEDLRRELGAAGFAEERMPALLADLRRRAPFEDRAARSPLALARARLDRARISAARGQRPAARAAVIDAYLEGIEPVESALRAADPSLVASLEERFLSLRGRLDAGASPAEVDEAVGALLTDVTRAERLLGGGPGDRSFVSTAVASAGILLREGVEAALLVAALLGIATQAGLGARRRWVHAGWASALALGGLTWFLSTRLIAISGASRELVEGVTAICATLVLFYVSYSLLAKREVARWMRFLRAQVSPRRAAASLFGVSFLAAYREAFETVLFYQTLLASHTSTTATLVGIAAGAVALAALVFAYSRAGRFAPPQVFFKVSSYLLYALAIVFAGQGVAALQLTGLCPIHPLALPSVPALGLHPTLETCVAQGALVSLAILSLVLSLRSPAPPSPATPPPAAAPGGGGGVPVSPGEGGIPAR